MSVAASLLLAAVGTEDLGPVSQEPSSDESYQAFGALEAARMPLPAVERDEFRIVDTYRVTRSCLQEFRRRRARFGFERYCKTNLIRSELIRIGKSIIEQIGSGGTVGK